MQKYDSYKNSGIQWLGEIPSHWECMQNRFIFQENVRTPDNDDIPLTLSQVDGLIPTDIMKEKSLKTSTYDNWKKVLVDDIVLNRFKAHLGVLFASKYEGMVSFHYGVFEKKRPIVPKYYEYLFHSNQFKLILGFASKGMTIGLQNLGNADFYNLKSLYPPLAEQHSIVAYLDSKCALIDKMLANKQRQIELLSETKQRTIADAVTRGIDKNVKLKKTNNICLPNVPTHWEVQRYGSLFKLKPVKPHHNEELLSVFLNLGVIKASESDKRTHAASEDLSKYQLVEETDFVMNNQQAWRGSVGVSKLVGIISPAYHIFIMPKCFDPDYANYLLRSKCIVGQFEMSSKGVGSIQRTLNFNWLNNKIVPVPPLAEQRAIVAYINDRVTKIDALASKLQQEIDNIKEYKQRLISDVVTGSIKV